MKKAANSSISLRNIHISDAFWRKYIRLVKDVIIPYQWDILNDNLEGVETSHCIENFRIAAGEKQGEYYGAVFQDTDVAKWLEAVGFVLNFERDEKLEKLETALDDIRRRFGNYAVQRASLLAAKDLSHFNPHDDHTIHPEGYFKEYKGA